MSGVFITNSGKSTFVEKAGVGGVCLIPYSNPVGELASAPYTLTLVGEFSSTGTLTSAAGLSKLNAADKPA